MTYQAAIVDRASRTAPLTAWVTYQRERFPLAAHAPLVAAFSGSAVCFSSRVRGEISLPSFAAPAVAFATSLLFFLQLRIADEFKDYEEDCRFRPYRPVPRGLVTLAQLRCVAVASFAVQFALALSLEPSLIWLLLVVWVYLALMTREFFAGAWLRRHPAAYMASHMLILPLIDMYATACDWRVAGLRQPPAGMTWFLVVSFLNGIVVEIGRKTRAPNDEEDGVETYSASWGVTGAVRAWLAAITLTAAAAWRAAADVGTAAPMFVLLLVLAALCVVRSRPLARLRTPGSGRALEMMSGVWTLVMYLGLGAAPLTIAIWRAGS
jgi:4-hydroxybenzoate polyprenyltransferase